MNEMYVFRAFMTMGDSWSYTCELITRNYTRRWRVYESMILTVAGVCYNAIRTEPFTSRLSHEALPSIAWLFCQRSPASINYLECQDDLRRRSTRYSYRVLLLLRPAVTDLSVYMHDLRPGVARVSATSLHKTVYMLRFLLSPTVRAQSPLKLYGYNVAGDCPLIASEQHHRERDDPERLFFAGPSSP